MAAVNAPLLVKAMASRGIDADALARATGYTPETVRNVMSGGERGTAAFAIAAETMMRLRAGTLLLESSED